MQVHQLTWITMSIVHETSGMEPNQHLLKKLSRCPYWVEMQFIDNWQNTHIKKLEWGSLSCRFSIAMHHFSCIRMCSQTRFLDICSIHASLGLPSYCFIKQIYRDVNLLSAFLRKRNSSGWRLKCFNRHWDEGK